MLFRSVPVPGAHHGLKALEGRADGHVHVQVLVGAQPPPEQDPVGLPLDPRQLLVARQALPDSRSGKEGIV